MENPIPQITLPAVTASLIINLYEPNLDKKLAHSLIKDFHKNGKHRLLFGGREIEIQTYAKLKEPMLNPVEVTFFFVSQNASEEDEEFFKTQILPDAQKKIVLSASFENVDIDAYFNGQNFDDFNASGKFTNWILISSYAEPSPDYEMQTFVVYATNRNENWPSPQEEEDFHSKCEKSFFMSNLRRCIYCHELFSDCQNPACEEEDNEVGMHMTDESVVISKQEFKKMAIGEIQ